METLATRLDQIMRDKRITNVELARKLGVDPSAVSQWRNAHTEPSKENLAKASDIFRVHLRWLSRGEGEKHTGHTSFGTNPRTVDMVAADQKYAEGQPNSWDEFQEDPEKIIEEVVKEGPPVSIATIARRLGVVIVTVDKEDEFSGSIRWNRDNECYVIEINANHHPNRQRFTSAHELAHYLKHRPLIGDGIIDDKMYRSGQPLPVEWEANRIAADLLMPRSLLEEAMNNGNMDVSELAKSFRVSYDAMAIRLGVPRIGN